MPNVRAEAERGVSKLWRRSIHGHPCTVKGCPRRVLDKGEQCAAHGPTSNPAVDRAQWNEAVDRLQQNIVKAREEREARGIK